MVTAQMMVNSVMIIFFIVFVVWVFGEKWGQGMQDVILGLRLLPLLLFSLNLNYLCYFLQSFDFLQFADNVLYVVAVMDAQFQ